MFSIILAMYLLIILIYIIVSLFIIYHLAKYSVNTRVSLIMLPLFITGAVILLIADIALFFSINWNFLNNFLSFQ